MASKALMVLGFLLAALLVISSEVAARELAESAKEEQTKEPVNDVKQYGHGGGYPRGGGGYPGHGGGYPPKYGGGGYPPKYGGYPPKHGGGGCRYGCCGHGPYGCRCCTYEGEVPDFKAEAKPHN